MNKKIFHFGFILAITLSIGIAGAIAQDNVKRTEVIQHPDGTYTVIEYPVDKEITVNLIPGTTLSGAKGSARVLRSADGTSVTVDVSGISDDAGALYAYAVDPTGASTFLGPIIVENGMGHGEFTTSGGQFMIVLAPSEGLTVVPDADVLFRSDVPEGQAIVPRGVTSPAGKEKQVASSGEVESAYQVPMLNVPSFDGKTAEIRIDFSGELDGLKGKAYVDPGADGTTQIKMRFDDMKQAPKDKRFVLWAAAPNGNYTKLGQVINTGTRQESEIRSETALNDFGLFVTVEETDVSQPTGSTYSVFRRP